MTAPDAAAPRQARPGPVRIALFGECMLELSGQAFGPMQQGYGGDTLNTAVYLARCSRGQPLQVLYATALGDDNLSAGMMARWAGEGIALDLVRRLPGRRPGLYLIEVDGHGERHFSYWRSESAARAYFDTPGATQAPTPLEAAALPCDWLYLSGISLAILPPAGRTRLLALLDRLRAAGGRVVFDNNYRPRLWPDQATAWAAYAEVLARCDLALLTLDDHQAVGGWPDAASALAAAHALPVAELVVKRGPDATLLRQGAAPWQAVPVDPVPRVVDTTAAGDSFAAGYLARRLLGVPPAQAAAFGNQLAGRVVQHHGAVIPIEAMADLATPPAPHDNPTHTPRFPETS